MNLKKWIDKYEKEAEEFNLLPGFSIYFKPGKGFFCWKLFGSIIEIDHTCTNDIKDIDNTIVQIAKENDCKIIRTSTARNPAAYMRLTKATPNIALSGIRPNGKFYWIFERKVI